MKKTLIITLGVVAILLLSGTAITYAMSKEVTVTFSDTDKKIEADVLFGSLADLLEKEGLDVETIKNQYQPSVKWTAPIEKNGTDIHLTCKCRVTLKVGAKEPKRIETTATTVKDVLQEQKIALTPEDQLNKKMDHPITNDLEIVIDRVEKRVEKKVKEVTFSTTKKEDPKLYKGEKKIETKGKKGKEIYQVTTTYKNGKEVKTETNLVKKVDPVDEIVRIGKKEKPAKESTELATSSSGESIAGLAYSRSFSAEATGYTATGNRTATGTVPKRGTVAVDPNVIPLGTKLYIPGYGKAVAEDTGGAVKGRIVDLFFTTENEAIQWGRRNVTVYILK